LEIYCVDGMPQFLQKDDRRSRASAAVAPGARKAIYNGEPKFSLQRILAANRDVLKKVFS
jgi:hypothetical protein